MHRDRIKHTVATVPDVLIECRSVWYFMVTVWLDKIGHGMME